LSLARLNTPGSCSGANTFRCKLSGKELGIIPLRIGGSGGPTPAAARKAETAIRLWILYILGASPPAAGTGLSAPIPQPPAGACGISASIPCASLYDKVLRRGKTEPHSLHCLDTGPPPMPIQLSPAVVCFFSGGF
jgi:hypothetical protein